MQRGYQGDDWIEVSVYRHLPASPGYWRDIADFMQTMQLEEGRDWHKECCDDWTFSGGVQHLLGQQIEFYFHPRNRKWAALFKLRFR